MLYSLRQAIPPILHSPNTLKYSIPTASKARPYMSRTTSNSSDLDGTDLKTRLGDAEVLLQRVRTVLSKKENGAITLNDWLERHEVIANTGVESADVETTTSHSIETLSLEPAPATTDDIGEEEEETVDISALTLSALLIRKRLASGQLDEVEGEQEILSLLSTAPGITREQEESVRKWAGM